MIFYFEDKIELQGLKNVIAEFRKLEEAFRSKTGTGFYELNSCQGSVCSDYPTAEERISMIGNACTAYMQKKQDLFRFCHVIKGCDEIYYLFFTNRANEAAQLENVYKCMKAMCQEAMSILIEYAWDDELYVKDTLEQ